MSAKFVMRRFVRSKSFGRRRLRLERMEDRVMLTAATWDPMAGDHMYNDAENWVEGVVPINDETTQFEVTIDQPGPNKITISDIITVDTLDIPKGDVELAVGFGVTYTLDESLGVGIDAAEDASLTISGIGTVVAIQQMLAA